MTGGKLLLLAVLFIIIAFYCYGQNILEFAMRPGANKKIKYELDVSKLQNLKKGAISKKVIEGIIKNYPQEKIKIKNREDGVIKYEIYEEGVSIEIYYDDCEKGALMFYEFGVSPQENRLYDYKGAFL